MSGFWRVYLRWLRDRLVSTLVWTFGVAVTVVATAAFYPSLSGASGEGLVRWRPEGARTFTRADGLSGSDVRALALDDADRIWAATEDGVSIVDTAVVSTIGVRHGLPHASVTSVSGGRDGWMWIATAGGVCRARADEVDGRLTRLWDNRNVRKLSDSLNVQFGFNSAELGDAAWPVEARRWTDDPSCVDQEVERGQRGLHPDRLGTIGAAPRITWERLTELPCGLDA